MGQRMIVWRPDVESIESKGRDVYQVWAHSAAFIRSGRSLKFRDSSSSLSEIKEILDGRVVVDLVTKGEKRQYVLPDHWGELNKVIYPSLRENIDAIVKWEKGPGGSTPPSLKQKRVRASLLIPREFYSDSPAKEFRLTQDQEEALNRIDYFINHSSARIFVLKGYAGTGKTTLIRHLVRWILEHTGYRVVLLASTGRAARILEEKTGIGASTVHSQIYEFSKLEASDRALDPNDVEQIRLRFGLRSPRKAYVLRDGHIVEEEVRQGPIVYLVDEASMLSNEKSRYEDVVRFGTGRLLSDFFEYVWKVAPGGGDNKIIFVGDAAQLPPVASVPFSPALHPPTLKKIAGYDVEEVELTEIVRQEEDSEILDLAFELREYILKGRYPSWQSVMERNWKGDIRVYENMREWMANYIYSLHAYSLTHSIIITHSNAQSLRLNRQVRELIHYANDVFDETRNLTPDVIQYARIPEWRRQEVGSRIFSGDLMMVMQNHPSEDISNGDQVLLTAYHEHQKRYQAGFSFVPIEMVNIHTGSLFNILLLKHHVFSENPNISPEETRDLIINFDIRFRKRFSKNEYVPDRNSDEYLQAMREDPYLNALRAKFGYASTVHKAQGGEWPEVFLNLSRSLRYMKSDEARFRWLYTAVTRAKKKLHIRKVFEGGLRSW